MAILTQRALLYARDAPKVYTIFRNKARSMVAELEEQGVDHVYLQGNELFGRGIAWLNASVQLGHALARNSYGEYMMDVSRQAS